MRSLLATIIARCYTSMHIALQSDNAAHCCTLCGSRSTPLLPSYFLTLLPSYYITCYKQIFHTRARTRAPVLIKRYRYLTKLYHTGTFLFILSFHSCFEVSIRRAMHYSLLTANCYFHTPLILPSPNAPSLKVDYLFK